MGCATSKQKKVCRKCQTPYSPVRRSNSVQKTGDAYHLVALTSSTLDSLKLDPFIQNHAVETPADAPFLIPTVAGDKPPPAKDGNKSAKEEFAMGMIEAKTWSSMIDGKIPKIPPVTPVITPPGEPEMINAWEMMEGLEDSSPLRPPHLRSFSFPAGFSSIDDQPTPRVKENNGGEDLPPAAANPFQLETINTNNGKDKLIVYFTSLRGVRKTYEECCEVLVILKRLGVKVDERDVSMDSRFKEELKELTAASSGGGGVSLPSVYLGGKCMGGAEEIRRLNEEGMLEKLVENCEIGEDGGGDGGGNGGVCEACGDVRFVPCETCSGSCKIYYEEEEEDEFEENEESCGFQRCPNCNENGLIRCPICCH